ncbi:MAG: 16S rRNA (uracil(1498)-N(3))-methyltransferase [Kiritimatiellae bacterium]|nr:16S rRNA (uracil(1498)-N(3))-methyltransferase [Kiritimatiellia bacterium]
MNRILFKADEVPASGRVVLGDDRADHIRSVLCSALHDTIRVGILNGPSGEGEVVALDDVSVELACQFESTPPEVPPLDLLLAMPRPKVMKRLWAPLASLGLGRIIITNAARVERNYFDTHWLDPANYDPLLIEGLQQAGATRLPEVTVARRFRPLVEDRLDELCPGTRRIVAHPHDAAPLEAELASEPDQRLLLAVGPEGGWVPFELELMQSAGFRAVSLPFGALRTDVACIALIAVANALHL